MTGSAHPGANPSARQVLVPDTPTALSACLAVALPMLVAFNMPPSATMFNQALALFGWGSFVALLASGLPSGQLRWPAGLKALLCALVLVLGAALASPLWASQSISAPLYTLGTLGAAALAAALGAALQRTGLGPQAMRSFCVAILVAATLSSFIALVQMYAPALIDGQWIASSDGAGRAMGNVRQSNHLCSILLLGLVALVWAMEAHVVPRIVAGCLAVVLVFAVVLTASRSGAVGALLLAVWGLADKKLSARTRWALLLAPVVYLILWAAAAAWANHAQQSFSGQTRITGVGSLWSGTRLDIWANSMALIAAHPWVGAGWGEFNFAWSLTPFPVRSGEFFDNAHNLPLHLAVELGLPLAALVLGLLGWAVWLAARNSWRSDSGESGLVQRCAFAMLVLILVHSMLEYPLWYAYFLLPAAFAFGLCLGVPGPGGTPTPAISQKAKPATIFRPLALLMMLGAGLAVYDYFRVVVIFTAPENAAPLMTRIQEGKGSWLFSDHAHYAEMTVSKDPAIIRASAERAAHHIMDMRLMVAWADSLHTTGETEKAKYIAQRVKEFPKPEALAYFAPCSDPVLAEAQKPYQCSPPTRSFTYRDFR